MTTTAAAPLAHQATTADTYPHGTIVIEASPHDGTTTVYAADALGIPHEIRQTTGPAVDPQETYQRATITAHDYTDHTTTTHAAILETGSTRVIVTPTPRGQALSRAAAAATRAHMDDAPEARSALAAHAAHAYERAARNTARALREIGAHVDANPPAPTYKQRNAWNYFA